MAKDIYITLPDGEVDYDGDEEEDDVYNEMAEDWRFEMNTYNY